MKYEHINILRKIIICVIFLIPLEAKRQSFMSHVENTGRFVNFVKWQVIVADVYLNSIRLIR